MFVLQPWQVVCLGSASLIPWPEGHVDSPHVLGDKCHLFNPKERRESPHTATPAIALAQGSSNALGVGWRVVG